MEQQKETSGAFGLDPNTPTEQVTQAQSGPVTGNPFFNQELAGKLGVTGEEYEVYKPLVDKVADTISAEAVNRLTSPDNIKRNYIQRKQLVFQQG